ncbi:hypothetical protein F5144DRAFT_568765 [Chaetomium tenue]|uniref:Uncharacterized protein n=1 Tax=Chaetomium tenue TaxID=1854479 RepID=A0ACB7PEQ4_9PEZI|nr:hypothetical protein F5144DRAFT_568765 [Chaetomium globosum]
MVAFFQALLDLCWFMFCSASFEPVYGSSCLAMITVTCIFSSKVASFYDTHYFNTNRPGNGILDSVSKWHVERTQGGKGLKAKKCLNSTYVHISKVGRVLKGCQFQACS